MKTVKRGRGVDRNISASWIVVESIGRDAGWQTKTHQFLNSNTANHQLLKSNRILSDLKENEEELFNPPYTVAQAIEIITVKRNVPKSKSA
jgi:hypothetical protein